MIELQQVAWAEKFRPSNLGECFLPSETRSYIESFLESDSVPSMLFCGPAGIGKTTTAIAIANQLDLEFIKINGSMYGNIDTLRNEIQQFASTMSFNGKKKLIILDEADHLSIATQAALRGFIDDYSSNASFILTANFLNKISEPIISRLTKVDFLFPNSEKKELAVQLYKFILTRLDEENVKYENSAIQMFLRQNLSKTADIRKIITAAQKIARSGVFNSESIVSDFESRMDEMIESVKSRDFEKMRKWVGENSDIESAEVFRAIYDRVSEIAKGPVMIMVISILNEYQYKHAFVIDKEINVVTCLAEVAAAISSTR